MRKTFATLMATTLMLAPAAIAFAGGSDDPTPYTVTTEGVRLPNGDVFLAHGHINIRTNQRNNIGIHFDPNNNHPGGAFIGESFYPYTLAEGECVEWVQSSLYNEHFGEGGQGPVCAEGPPVDEPPVEEEPPVDEEEPPAEEEPTIPRPDDRIMIPRKKPTEVLAATGPTEDALGLALLGGALIIAGAGMLISRRRES